MTDAPPPTYKIIELRAENLKKLTAITIRPDGPLVRVAGRNGSGKTSTLDAIFWAISGVRNIQIEPIRRGAQKALIKLDMGDLVVTRRFNAKEEGGFTTSLTVENADGSRFGSPQAVLDAIVGELAFDPVAFGRMKPDEQFDAVRALVPGVDFGAIASANKVDFEERTNVNRRAKELRSQAAGISLPAGKIPRKVDLGALEQELGSAAAHNSEVATRRSNREAAEADIIRLQDEIRTRTEHMHALQQKVAKAEALPALIDVAEVQGKLTAGREANATVEAAERKGLLDADALKLEEESEALTKRMSARDADKEKAIAAAKMPIKALSFGDGVVLLNGVPFNQASDAQQLLASVAIASALNPRLRVVRIRDGSLLDEDAMKALEKMATEADMQIWVEKVTNGERVGFVLEDGHLVGEEPGPSSEEEEAIG